MGQTYKRNTVGCLPIYYGNTQTPKLGWERKRTYDANIVALYVCMFNVVSR